MREEVINLLLQILVKTSYSSADKKIIYPLLQDNLDKLDKNFADLLRFWSKNYFARENLPYKVQTVAGIIIGLTH